MSMFVLWRDRTDGLTVSFLWGYSLSLGFGPMFLCAYGAVVVWISMPMAVCVCLDGMLISILFPIPCGLPWTRINFVGSLKYAAGSRSTACLHFTQWWWSKPLQFASITLLCMPPISILSACCRKSLRLTSTIFWAMWWPGLNGPRVCGAWSSFLGTYRSLSIFTFLSFFVLKRSDSLFLECVIMSNQHK